MRRSVYPEMLLKQKELLEQKGYDFDVFQSKSVIERYNILYDLQEEYLGHNKPINNITPIVSVCIPTYQHHKYIRECIEGALMQQTSFLFEIVIGDDGSVDGTTEICMEYAEKYPDKIRFYNRTRELCRVFDSEGHIERSGNWWWTLQEGRGKYIAICEGDDYWIDSLKLQKQMDFLEANESYSMVHSNFFIYTQGREDMNEYHVLDSSQALPENILLFYRIQTTTVMVRTDMLLQIINSDDFFSKKDFFLMGDVPLFFLLSLRGSIGVINAVTAVYRIVPNSASHKKNTRKKRRFALSSMELRMYLAKKYHLSHDFYMRISRSYNKRLLAYLLCDVAYIPMFPFENWGILGRILNCCKKNRSNEFV